MRNSFYPHVIKRYEHPHHTTSAFGFGFNQPKTKPLEKQFSHKSVPATSHLRTAALCQMRSAPLGCEHLCIVIPFAQLQRYVQRT